MLSSLLRTRTHTHMYSYVSFFNLPKPTDSIAEVTHRIAHRNKVYYDKKVNVDGAWQTVKKLDFEHGAVKLINAYRKGQLGKIMLDDPFKDVIKSSFNFR